MVAPSAETIAPGNGPPSSSLTIPLITPPMTAFTVRTCGPRLPASCCASADEELAVVASATIPAAESTCFMRPMAPPALRSRNGECHIARQRLPRRQIRYGDSETILAFLERRQQDPLTCQYRPGHRIKTRPHYGRLEMLRRRPRDIALSRPCRRMRFRVRGLLRRWRSIPPK